MNVSELNKTLESKIKYKRPPLFVLNTNLPNILFCNYISNKKRLLHHVNHRDKDTKKKIQMLVKKMDEFHGPTKYLEINKFKYITSYRIK